MTREALVLVPVAVAVNAALGALVRMLQLPVFLDAIGTIAVTLILGLRAGLLVAVLSSIVAGLVNPVMFWFTGTQAAIALYAHLVAGRGGMRTWPRTVVAGVGLGIVAGIVSAPVVVAVFGGATGSGSAAIVAFLRASGEGLLKSVFLSGLASEPLDKTLQCLAAVWLVRRWPKSIYFSRPASFR